MKQYLNALCNSFKKRLTRTINTKEFKGLQLAASSRHRNCFPGYRNCVSAERTDSTSCDIAVSLDGA